MVNTVNCIKLAELLEADAVNPNGVRFDIRTIGEMYYPSPLDEDAEEKWVPGADCGTMACAMGLAGLSGIFADQGFTARKDPNDLASIQTLWNGKVRSYFDIGEDLLGIDDSTVCKLFNPECYSRDIRTGEKGELAVAKRLRYVARYGNLNGFDLVANEPVSMGT